MIQKVFVLLKKNNSGQTIHSVIKYLGLPGGRIHSVKNCYAHGGREQNYQWPNLDLHPVLQSQSYRQGTATGIIVARLLVGNRRFSGSR